MRVGKLVRPRRAGEDGPPMLYVFSNCVNLIRSLPMLQHDPRRPEDLGTTGDDHCANALRYAIAASRGSKSSNSGRLV